MSTKDVTAKSLARTLEGISDAICSLDNENVILMVSEAVRMTVKDIATDSFSVTTGFRYADKKRIFWITVVFDENTDLDSDEIAGLTDIIVTDSYQLTAAGGCLIMTFYMQCER